MKYLITIIILSILALSAHAEEESHHQMLQNITKEIEALKQQVDSLELQVAALTSPEEKTTQQTNDKIDNIFVIAGYAMVCFGGLMLVLLGLKELKRIRNKKPL